jgi:Subtilase family/Bacterial Ig domain/Fibronectin type III domain/Peptidase inhibitor I9
MPVTSLDYSPWSYQTVGVAVGGTLRRRLTLVITLALSIGVLVTPAAEAAPPTAAIDTWIVTLDPAWPAAEHAFGIAAAQRVEVEHVYYHVINGFSFRGSEAAAAAIAHNPHVRRVEHTRVLEATEIGPNGVLRIDAWAAHGAGHDGRMADGTPVRVAILDTGITPSHVDLSPNIVPAEGKNCINEGVDPIDGQGHGTHVAGTVAAAYNGPGVVGTATDAALVPVKVLDDTGFGTDAQVICGLDHVLALASDGTPTVVNMSLGELHGEGAGCGSSAMHQAICNVVDADVTVVAAAGNNAIDAESFFPAAYPEVIAVSAFSDLDGVRSFAGCGFWLDIFSQCDDTLASFTNFGSVIDVAAPGVRVYSTTFDGAWGLNSGTSMASPHVAGVAALVLAADPTLSPAEVRDILRSTGECPDGAVANAATCAGHGQWQMSAVFGGTGPDPDGIPEPLVNALRAADAAAARAGGGDTAPSAAITAPADGATVSGVVPIEITASDAEDAVETLIVEWSVDGGATWSEAIWNGSVYAASWDTAGGGDGPATVEGRATDSVGNTTSASPVDVTVDNGSPPPSMVDDHADGESAAYGTVSGSFQDTLTAGGGTEAITEEESGGRPDRRTSQLDHAWTITVSGGEVVTFFVDATANDQGDGEGFTFAYSTDGATFTDMLTVDATTTASMSFVLPPSTQGEVTVRVTDTDRTSGNRSLDTLWIDHMYIRSESPGPGSPPIAPSGVEATGVGSDMIEVTWSDGTGGSASSEIERRVAGGPWSFAGAAPAGSDSFLDMGLTPDTTYEYRVRAYTAEGVSTWSASASGTTLAAPTLALAATGYKVKGVQHVELVWSGAAGSYDVFRDDVSIATVSSTGYVDNLGVKGGGSYTYRVCVAGTTTCSNPVQVTF